MEKNGNQIDELFQSAFAGFSAEAPAGAYAGVRKQLFWAKFWKLGLHFNVYIIVAAMGCSLFLVNGNNASVGTYEPLDGSHAAIEMKSTDIHISDFKSLNTVIDENRNINNEQMVNNANCQTSNLTDSQNISNNNRVNELNEMTTVTTVLESDNSLNKEIKGGTHLIPVKKKQKIRIDD